MTLARSLFPLPPTAACLCAALAVTPAVAQDSPPPHRLSVELNAAQPQDAGCKLSFVVTNSHPADVAKAVFETVIFDSGGQVERLTLFDFGILPANRPRVRQFVLADVRCDGIGQILFNGASTCDAEGLSGSACTDDMVLHSRTDIEVTG